ncbi:FAD-binding protein [Aeromicrobium sp. A1-2]|uniref:FAD-binding protein n=1 Tax=Aeromicrobium sp. A1-2 TaxID=2107713 RepID=UPI000E47173E|nr:FAD-binding protein [Aeromicrobium sp. A1-2]AXT85745.1 FAD-binding protein [Aeromicrobium sp. A1-2]
MTGTNWAGNLTYHATALHQPGSIEELSALVAAAPSARALGSRHSFNAIADTTGVQISVAGLPPVVEVDAAAREVTVSAGLRYGELVEELDQAGWALHNLASLPHISVAGAIATGTHGSGDRNGSLASSVAGLELVTADGTVRSVRRGDPDFDGMVVSLGLLGVVTKVTLDIIPTFQIRQDLYEGVPWESIETDLDAITGSAYSVSLFTDWGAGGAGQAWVKSRADAAPREEFFGARPAARQLHPLPGEQADVATTQLGAAGPWWDRLPHFRLGFTPSNGEELQTEYLVPREHALEAIRAVRALAPRVQPHLLISEIRTIAADALWLSPSHSVGCLAIHFTWRMHVPEVTALLPVIDAALAPCAARPHWGKVFETAPQRLLEAYPRIPDLRALADRLDPEQTFANRLTSHWLSR